VLIGFSTVPQLLLAADVPKSMCIPVLYYVSGLPIDVELITNDVYVWSK
jgi:hypothetical protein